MRKAFRVLVVDDDEAMVRTLADILRMKGMEVLTAFSAEQARGKILRNDIDCVICDVRLPDEDGVALYLSLKKRAPNLPFLLMTAYASDEVIQEGLREGILGVLTKPLDIEAFLALCQELQRHHSLLIIDDDPIFREALGETLRARGYQVLEVLDPAQVEEAIRERRCGVLLLDLKLPGLSGIDLLRRLRARQLPSRVILMTAYAEELKEEIQEGLELGAEACLIKPFEIPELEDELRQIRSKAARDLLAGSWE